MTWIRALNHAADAAGSIHDDEEARKLGFPGGLVPGNVQLALTGKAAVQRLGSQFFERGYLRHTWIKPVHSGEEVRITGDIGLEKRDGTLVADATARLDEEVTWSALPEAGDDYDPLPEPVGFDYGSRTINVDAERIARFLGGYDDSPWYVDGSPWGEPVVPTVAQVVLSGYAAPDTPPQVGRELRAGMNASVEVFHREPMFRDRDYLRTACLVAKGAAGRYAYRVIEFETLDGDKPLNAFRWKVKWVTSRPSF